MKLIESDLIKCPYNLLIDYIVWTNGYVDKTYNQKQYGSREVISKGTSLSLESFFKHSDGSISFRVMTDSPIKTDYDSDGSLNEGHAVSNLAYESRSDALDDGWRV